VEKLGLNYPEKIGGEACAPLASA